MPGPEAGDPSFRFNRAPERECDLVMKGGITSGVVYPPAVLKLQETFRFRCIGGTSAGAIAAAVTAAAELDRERGGFERLDELRRQLAQPGFLMNLFKPTAQTAPAFEVLCDLFLTPDSAAPADASAPRGPRWMLRLAWRARRSLARHFTGATNLGRGCGALIGVAPVALILLGLEMAGALATTLSRPSVAVPLAALALGGWIAGALAGGAAAGAIAFGRVFTHHLPAGGSYGLCPGYDGPHSPNVLTAWLAREIDRLAGKPEGADPVTFGDLAQKRGPQGQDAGITLRMVTTNLSHGQPYVFPRDGDIFLFDERDMAGLFPARIVDYLKRAGGTGDLPLPPGTFFLPKGDKLPVVFATRLSLSFPILLSAVRLYTIKPAAFGELRRRRKAGLPFTFDRAAHLQENWFSDGGISSNFPIHFFDRWLPSRPTFGINLSGVPETAKTDGTITPEHFSAVPEDPAAGDEREGVDDVYLPHPRENARGLPPWTPVRGLPGFLMAAFDTARNYRDTMQAMLPSYRERVVQVRLTAREGGLNLAMDPATIRRIGDKGCRAGTLLTGMDFEQHQWVRLRVLMAYLERGVCGMGDSFPELDRYGALLNRQLEVRQTAPPGQRWYRPEDEAWCKRALERLDAVVRLTQAWTPEFFGVDPPRPEAALRVTPPL